MQKKFTFEFSAATITFHYFTESHTEICSELYHNKYNIYIILLWRFYQDTKMCELVKMWGWKIFLHFLRKKLEKGKCLTYLCIVIWKRIAHVSVTFGVRTRCVRVRQHNNANLTFRAQNKDNSPNPIRHNSKKYESRIDNSYRKLTRCVEEGWLLLPDMQRTADRAKMSTEMDGYTCTQGSEGEIYWEIW